MMTEPPPHKTCTRCGQYEPLAAYHQMRRRSRDGYRPRCRACRAADARAFRRLHRPTLAARDRARDATPARHRQNQAQWRRYYAEHRAAINARRRVGARIPAAQEEP
jgi:hypothetical protein